MRMSLNLSTGFFAQKRLYIDTPMSAHWFTACHGLLFITPIFIPNHFAPKSFLERSKMFFLMRMSLNLSTGFFAPKSFLERYLFLHPSANVKLFLIFICDFLFLCSSSFFAIFAQKHPSEFVKLFQKLYLSSFFSFLFAKLFRTKKGRPESDRPLKGRPEVADL